MAQTNGEETTARVLRAAAWYIEEHGWCQGRWENEEGKVCLDGAILRVMGQFAGHKNFSARYIPIIGALGPEVGYSPIGFNDTDGRTEQEVTAALRRAADRLDPSGTSLEIGSHVASEGVLETGGVVASGTSLETNEPVASGHDMETRQPVASGSTVEI